MKPSPTRVATVYALKTAAYRDSSGEKLDSKEVAAIRAKDPKKLGQVMDALYGDNAYLYLDGYGRPIGEIFAEEGYSDDPWKFIRQAESAANQFAMKRSRDAIRKSPWKKELKAIGKAMDYPVTPDEGRYIKYQPRKRKGIYTSAILQDMGGRMGHGKWVIDEDDAKRAGTTLKKVFEALNALNAKLVSRGLGPGGKKPWIDYDGWAY